MPTPAHPVERVGFFVDRVPPFGRLAEMTPDQAEKFVVESASVTREDISRAKLWLLEHGEGQLDEKLEEWLGAQNARLPHRATVYLEAESCEDQLKSFARTFSLGRAFCQAAWELVINGEMLPTGGPAMWEPYLNWKTSHYSAGWQFKSLQCTYPSGLFQPPLASRPSTDPDIFLSGISCQTLHDGIREAVEHSLLCFRRGLYLPATAMLAAAAEGAWTECGAAVAKHLTKSGLGKLMGDPLSSISRKVAETHRALQTPDGAALVKAAGRSAPEVDTVVLWTKELRDRRNALHWGKAKSFRADHGETGILLMGAPQNIGTLEAIRTAC